jgi:3-methyl-2-oxobutanoate hydroxymethyltransferase
MGQRPTVRDLLDSKGKRKLVGTTALDEWTAKACQEAGVDLIVTWASTGRLEELKYVMEQVRRGAPDTLIGAHLPLIGAYTSDAEALRLAAELTFNLSVDVIFATGMVTDRFSVLSRQRFPCVGHVGYLPVRNTWFGGPRAVGKSAEEALQVYDDVVELAAAGVIAVEMECVPHEVAAEITKRVPILTFSMGSGAACDGQLIFSSDLIGTTLGHYPRHSMTYANLGEQATAAMARYREDVVNGTYPADRHVIGMSDDQHDRFMSGLRERDL